MPSSASCTSNPLFWLNDSSEVLPPVNDQWQARREVADALRNLNNALLTADVSTELLRRLAGTLRTEVADIEGYERIFGQKARSKRLLEQHEQPFHLPYETGPVCGLSNAISPPMRFWAEEGRIHALVTLGWAYEGPPGSVHGGVIALLFDQLVGVIPRTTGSGGRTGSLTVRYHHPTPLNKTLRMVANVVRVEGRKQFMAGEIWVDDVLTASCEGIAIALNDKPA